MCQGEDATSDEINRGDKWLNMVTRGGVTLHCVVLTCYYSHTMHNVDMQMERLVSEST